jgi:membrane fusion protein, multidrug efflux system
MKLHIILTAILAISIISSCGDSSKKETNSKLTELKEQVEKKKTEKAALDKSIADLEKEINKLDTTKKEKAKLVAIETIGGGNFQHSIDLQGKVEAENITTVSPKYGPGLVSALYISKGSFVKAGQKILTLNSEPYIKQRQVLETQLVTAVDLYKRQKNLWDQNIGAEVQVISAKSQVETLEKNIAAINEQIKGATIYAPISGVADIVDIRVGETFGASPMPQIQLVNNGSLKLSIEVPENYLSRIGAGSQVQVNFPDNGQSFTTSVSRVAQSINTFSRSFTVEAKLPSGSNLKPNQLAIAKIIDYQTNNAIVVPINVVQTDEKGKYIMVADKGSNGKMYARKKHIAVGNMYGEGLEVKQGLTGGDQIIIGGYQNLFEGQLVTLN